MARERRNPGPVYALRHSVDRSGLNFEGELDWKFRITPEEIVDLGRQPLVPELNRIDELFYRIQRRLPTNELANPLWRHY